MTFRASLEPEWYVDDVPQEYIVCGHYEFGIGYMAWRTPYGDTIALCANCVLRIKRVSNDEDLS